MIPWLTILGLLPLLGAALIWLLPPSAADRARHLALATSSAVLVLVVALAARFDVSKAGEYQYSF